MRYLAMITDSGSHPGRVWLWAIAYAYRLTRARQGAGFPNSNS